MDSFGTAIVAFLMVWLVIFLAIMAFMPGYGSRGDCLREFTACEEIYSGRWDVSPEGQPR